MISLEISVAEFGHEHNHDDLHEHMDKLEDFLAVVGPNEEEVNERVV